MFKVTNIVINNYAQIQQKFVEVLSLTVHGSSN